MHHLTFSTRRSSISSSLDGGWTPHSDGLWISACQYRHRRTEKFLVTQTRFCRRLEGTTQEADTVRVRCRGRLRNAYAVQNARPRRDQAQVDMSCKLCLTRGFYQKGMVCHCRGDLWHSCVSYPATLKLHAPLNPHRLRISCSSLRHVSLGPPESSRPTNITIEAHRSSCRTGTLLPQTRRD